jgi:hypothetical protein
MVITITAAAPSLMLKRCHGLLPFVSRHASCKACGAHRSNFSLLMNSSVAEDDRSPLR